MNPYTPILITGGIVVAIVLVFVFWDAFSDFLDRMGKGH